MGSEDWQPIRITINYSQLFNDYNDEFKCTKDKVGKNITWGFEGKYVVTCTNELLLNQATIDSTVKAIENARKHLESMLKVKRLKGQYKLRPCNNGNIPNITYSDIDLYITVFPRIYPVDKSWIAVATITEKDKITYRPIQGYIDLNVRNLKQFGNLYNVLIHEITHILGILRSSYPFWHSHESNEKYGNKYISQIEIGGVNRTIINAPYSHNFAVNHFGVETFKSGNQEVRSGIILGNNDLSHPDQLYYYTELMTTNSMGNDDCPFERLTEVTMSLLMDTGYYKVDYTKGKPLWWGSKETNNGEFLKDFITGPPQKTFPYNYLVDPKRSDNLLTSGFDYSFVGATFLPSIDIPEYVKQNLSWYNPLNSPYFGNKYNEYQRILVPIQQCKEGTAAVNIKNEHAVCLPYGSDGPNIVFYRDDIWAIKCTKKDQEVIGGNGMVIICPDPTDFAVRVNLRYRNTFEYNPFEPRPIEEYNSSRWKIPRAVFSEVCRKGHRRRGLRRHNHRRCHPTAVFV